MFQVWLPGDHALRRWGDGLVRLSTHPIGGQGQPYGDEVVAQARELVETTWLSHKEIGARVGVSHMTICRWKRAGRWRLPPGAARSPDERGESLQAMQTYNRRTKPWRLLEEAEAILAAGPTPDRMLEALAWLLAAQALYRLGTGRVRRRSDPHDLPTPLAGEGGTAKP